MVIGLTALLQNSVKAQTIVGSDHDFSPTGPGTFGNWSGDRICIACHTPHNADLTQSDAPLWNHEVTGAVYTMYAGTGTLDASFTTGQPDGPSKLCLSCHDGTVALDSFGGAVGSTFLTGTAMINDVDSLQDDHPISFTYDAALVALDGGLHTPVAGAIGGLPLFGVANDELQCSTCHMVHDPVNGYFLRMSNVGSLLCLTCHDK